MDYKELINKEISDFITKATDMADSFDHKIREVDCHFKTVDTFFKSNKSTLDNFTHELNKFEYQYGKKFEELDSFMRKDFVSLEQAMKKLEDNSRSNMLNFNDVY